MGPIKLKAMWNSPKESPWRISGRPKSVGKNVMYRPISSTKTCALLRRDSTLLTVP